MSRLDKINQEMNRQIKQKELETKKSRKMGLFESASLLFGIGVFLAYNHPAFTRSWYAIYPGLTGATDYYAVVPFIIGFLLLCFLPPKVPSWLLLFLGQFIILGVMLRGIVYLAGIGWIVAYVVIVSWLAIGIYLYIRAYMDYKNGGR